MSTYHPKILNPATSKWETNWLMYYDTEQAALEYANAWCEAVHGEHYGVVEDKGDGDGSEQAP